MSVHNGAMVLCPVPPSNSCSGRDHRLRDVYVQKLQIVFIVTFTNSWHASRLWAHTHTLCTSFSHPLSCPILIVKPTRNGCLDTSVTNLCPAANKIFPPRLRPKLVLAYRVTVFVFWGGAVTPGGCICVSAIFDLVNGGYGFVSWCGSFVALFHDAPVLLKSLLHTPSVCFLFVDMLGFHQQSAQHWLTSIVAGLDLP